MERTVPFYNLNYYYYYYYLCVCARVCMHAYLSDVIAHMEVIQQLLRVCSLLPLWLLGIELMSLGLHDKHFYPLSHLMAPVLAFHQCYMARTE